ncbi:MAG TPA: hypothetical protein VMS74_04250 [Acidimicrobiia bacterium]|nr:hypothetical protein [Acidimicrobiia bacterium]
MLGLALVFVLVGAIVGFVTWRASGELRSFLIATPPALVAVAVLAHRSTILHYALITSAFATAGWLFERALVGLAVGIAFTAWAMARSRRIPADLTSDAIFELPIPVVGPGAQDYVEAFAAIGYQLVGALTFRTVGSQIIASIMVGPDSDRYATVTDSVLTVTSTFGHRSLVTRNSALSLMPPEALDNPLRGAGPAELDACHGEALALVTPHVAADTLDPATITAFAVSDERRAVEWVRHQPTHLQKGGGTGHGPLSTRPAATSLVAAWLEAVPEF